MVRCGYGSKAVWLCAAPKSIWNNCRSWCVVCGIFNGSLAGAKVDCTGTLGAGGSTSVVPIFIFIFHKPAGDCKYFRHNRNVTGF